VQGRQEATKHQQSGAVYPHITEECDLTRGIPCK
jgi:hypothetical protein